MTVTRISRADQEVRRVGLTVDTAKLLGEHDDTRSEGRTADTGNGEKLDEAVALYTHHGLFLLEKAVDEEDVSACLQWRGPDSEEGAIRLRITPLAHEPSGAVPCISIDPAAQRRDSRFRAKVNLGHANQRGYTGGSQHETPVEAGDVGGIRHIAKRERHDKAHHDSKGGENCDAQVSRVHLKAHGTHSAKP
jgi:hypothetical protein